MLLLSSWRRRRSTCWWAAAGIRHSGWRNKLCFRLLLFKDTTCELCLFWQSTSAEWYFGLYIKLTPPSGSNWPATLSQPLFPVILQSSEYRYRWSLYRLTLASCFLFFSTVFSWVVPTAVTIFIEQVNITQGFWGEIFTVIWTSVFWIWFVSWTITVST